jgi:hypothetical protein
LETEFVSRYDSEHRYREALFAAEESRWFRRASSSSDAAPRAAHFLAGLLYPDGFRLFHNGGMPLLERRFGALRQEILIVGGTSRIGAQVHLSHEGVQELRSRYTMGRPLSVIASGNVGRLDLPPSWIVWDITSGTRAIEAFAATVRDLALPWFGLFEEPYDLLRALMELDVALLKPVSAVEWVLSEFGQRDARDLLARLEQAGRLPLPASLRHMIERERSARRARFFPFDRD